MTFILHGMARSPRVRATLVAMIECGAPHRFEPMAIGDNRAAAHLARHPFGRVPVLEHGDFTLYETQAILRYVARLHPAAALTPSDPRHAARMDQIIAIVDNYYVEAVTGGIARARLLAAMRGVAPDEAAIAAAVPMARLCWDVFDGLMGGDPFIAGPAHTLADIMLAPQVAVLARTPEGMALLGAHPKLAGWFERMRARPAMAATEPERLMQAA